MFLPCRFQCHVQEHGRLLEHGGNSPESQVIDTLMHEIAHAIVDIEFSKTGRVMAHGKRWKAWARRLGATPKATIPLSELGDGAVEKFSKEKRPNKYHIVYIDNVTNPSKVEVVHSCKRKLVRLSSRGMRGRDETYGKLYHIRVEDYEKFQAHPEILTTKIFI